MLKKTQILFPLLYMAIIYQLSDVPGVLDEESSLLSSIYVLTPASLQNLLHIPMFGLLAWLWRHSLEHYQSEEYENPWLLHSIAAVISIAYGIYDEIHQSLVPGRFATVNDALFNIIGILLALYLFHHKERFKKLFIK